MIWRNRWVRHDLVAILLPLPSVIPVVSTMIIELLCQVDKSGEKQEKLKSQVARLTRIKSTNETEIQKLKVRTK